MSKLVKQMQMDALKQTFSNVKNLVLLTQDKLDAVLENQIRLSLRKKNVRLHMVKNSLARRVFDELGVRLKDVWTGNTVVAWGGGESVKELSREIEAVLKEVGKKDPKIGEKLKVKTAVAEGEQVSFEQALTMPTRLEAIGEVVAMILGPGSALAACLQGPGAQIASQIESKTKEESSAGAST
jgi:large subunit ribosomal protein L10